MVQRRSQHPRQALAEKKHQDRGDDEKGVLEQPYGAPTPCVSATLGKLLHQARDTRRRVFRALEGNQLPRRLVSKQLAQQPVVEPVT